jgi:Sulfotransferase domain
MTIRVIGAGVGRTGTTSLQMALQILLGGRCYHMHEVFSHPDDIAVWHDAASGRMPNWHTFLQDWTAAIDWPASAFWEELAQAFPDALIVLSYRDPEVWWQSASNTIFPATLQAQDNPWRRMVWEMFKHRFTTEVENREAAIAAYEAHNAYVRAHAPAGRLLEWQASDGWERLCAALGLPVPDMPFPHANTTADFKERVGAAVPAPKR